MRVYGLEKYIGRTLVDLDIDRNFDEETDVITLKFDDGSELEFWAGTQTNSEGMDHAEIQFAVAPEHTVVFK